MLFGRHLIFSSYFKRFVSVCEFEMRSYQHEKEKDSILGHDGQLVTQQLSIQLLRSNFGEVNKKLILILSKDALN